MTGGGPALVQIDDLAGEPSPSGDRLSELAREFEAVVTAKDFPCIFSAQPFATREIYFGIVPDPSEVAEASVVLLRELCAVIRKFPDAIGVIFVDGITSTSISDDFELAGEIVRAVMRANAGDRPGVVLPGPDEPEWMLWLDGVGLFVNFSSPLHRARRSRNVGSAFTIVAQARESFDQNGRSSPKARSEIRRRLTAYDDIPPHPCLGRYGDPDSREALQFFLGDGTEPFDPTGA